MEGGGHQDAGDPETPGKSEVSHAVHFVCPPCQSTLSVFKLTNAHADTHFKTVASRRKPSKPSLEKKRIVESYCFSRMRDQHQDSDEESNTDSDVDNASQGTSVNEQQH